MSDTFFTEPRDGRTTHIETPSITVEELLCAAGASASMAEARRVARQANEFGNLRLCDINMSLMSVTDTCSVMPEDNIIFGPNPRMLRITGRVGFIFTVENMDNGFKLTTGKVFLRKP
jgi:hypothetical protein